MPSRRSAARIVFFTGKGGVGKTTTAAATAALAAMHGHRTLLLSADPAHSLGDVLSFPLTPNPTLVWSPNAEPRASAQRGRRGSEAEARRERDTGARRGLGEGVRPRGPLDHRAGTRGSRRTPSPSPQHDARNEAPSGTLHALEVDTHAEMQRHWGAIRDYLTALFRHQGIEAIVADELALLPGAEEMAALLAVEQHAKSGAYDLVVVDCAPTGATLRLVTLPEVATRGLRLALRLQRAFAATVTPLARAVLPVPLPDAGVFRELEALLYERLAAIRELLLAPGTTVRIVATPERMVIDEAVRAHTDLCLFELACDALVMNRLLPPEAAAEPGFAEWGRVHAERLAEVEALFPGLPILRAPLAPDEVTGPAALAAHGAVLHGAADAARDPAARLADPPRLRFARRADAQGAFAVELPLPGARGEELDVAKLDDALLVRTGALRRAIPLPRRLARLSLASARLDGGRLVVRLAPGSA